MVQRQPAFDTLLSMFLFFVIAVALTVKSMAWNMLPETVCRMDAASERTWMYLQRVSGNMFHAVPNS